MSVKSIFKDSVTVVLLRFKAHLTVRDTVLPVAPSPLSHGQRPCRRPAPCGCNLGLYCIGTLGRNSYSGDANGHQGILLPALAVCPCSWSPH